MLWDTMTGEKRYIWSRRNGFSCVTSNYNIGMIAAAEYGINPFLHIYDTLGREMISMPMDTTVKCIALSFSRDGRHLIMIGGVPDFKMTIFDLEKNQKLVMEEAKLPCRPEEFVSVKFNPKDHNHFAIMSQTVFYNYKIHPAYDYNEGEEDKVLLESFRLHKTEYRDEDTELQFQKFIFDPYDRVHICTNRNMVIQVDTKTLKMENQLMTTNKVATILLTHVHMIVSQEEGLIQWFKIEQPEEYGSEKENQDKKLKVLDEVEQEFSLESYIGESDERETISHMHYSKTFKQLILGTSTGLIGRLEVEAENVAEEDNASDNQQQKEKVIIDKPMIQLGRFNTKKLNGLKELGQSTQIITTSEDHYMTIWEATTGELLSSVHLPSYPTAIDVNEKGTVAFVGTQHGIFRIYDITNRKHPRLLQQIKFFEQVSPIINLQCSFCGDYVLVSNANTNQMYIISQDPQKSFMVLGHYQFIDKIVSASFTAFDGKTSLIVLLNNNLLVGTQIPTKPIKNRRQPITEEESPLFYKKVDKGQNLVMANHLTQDIFLVGQDKIMKRYEFPNEKYEKLDFKKPPAAPAEEIQSHSIGTNCWAISKEFKQFVTGGKDGTLILRSMNNMGKPNEIKAHTLFTGGVTAVTFSNQRSTLYSAGGDGTLMAWTIGGKPNPQQPINLDDEVGSELQNLAEIERQSFENIKLFQEILEEEFKKEQEDAKEQFRQTLLDELSQIKDSLMTLLAENEQATDIERLERDEFVIDTKRKERIVVEGDQECEEIRKEAEKTVLRLQLLRDRVKKSTWDQMEIQSKAVKSIQSDTLIFNYPIRLRQDQERRHFNIAMNARKIELTEKLKRIDNNIAEILEERDFSNNVENYIMNRVQGKPNYIDDDAIEQAAQEFLQKEQEKKEKKDKAEQNLIQQQTGGVQQGKKQPILKITKGKLGNKTKKRDDDEDEKDNDKNKMMIREIKGMEEMHWRIEFKKMKADELRSKLEKPNVFDMLYEPHELYPDVRKRRQIELLKAVIFELKQDFNKEFHDLETFKADCVFSIQERNEQISELLFNLKQEEELFEPKEHILEKPDHILHTSEEEVKVTKYLTKEERAALEEEQRKQAEREAALKGDNVGQRGLKTMMGGTELNLKKEKNSLEMEYEMEEWMTKEEKDMTEEEKVKFKEFKQKEKEFKDKQRKHWEQELKKLKADIIETQLKFEERLLRLYKKKLFIDVRIMEQELYIIRLVIMLHDAKETKTDEFKYRQEIEKLEEKKNQKIELINTFKGFINDLERRFNDDQKFRDQEKELRKMFPDLNPKQVVSFVKVGKGKKPTLSDELQRKKNQLMETVIDLDPFSSVDKDRITKQIQEEDEIEQFDFEKDNTVNNASPDDFEKLIQEREARVQMNKDKEKLEKQIKMMQDHINYHEENFREIEDNYETQLQSRKKALDRISKIMFNFECVVYLKQGQIEVPQLPVATDYKDAILIQKEIIDQENADIQKKGKFKIDLMEKISKFKVDLKKVSIQKERLELEIIDFEERAKDVQLYRVTKQTQEIIQGKHQKKDEEDKKRLENQIKQLEENANKRIKTINETKMKLKREIREKRMESEQLETKARQLQNNVDQRKQIMSLKSNTMNDGDADPSKKIKEVAHKRKLLDIAKQQTEEIEVLRDELDRLRARTFPSFAHLHNKPGYPDEN